MGLYPSPTSGWLRSGQKLLASGATTLSGCRLGCTLSLADLFVYEKTHGTIHVLDDDGTRRHYSLVRKFWKKFGHRVWFSDYSRDSEKMIEKLIAKVTDRTWLLVTGWMRWELPVELLTDITRANLADIKDAANWFDR